MTKSDTPPPTKPTEREALQREHDAAQRILARRKGKPRMPRVRLTENARTASVAVAYDHDDPTTATMLLMDAMGTGDERFAQEMLSQVVSLGAHGRRVSEGASNFALSVVAAVEPRDALEAMLAAQMAAVHQATMMMARRLNHVENIPQQDAAERALNKLARTYAGQMETLKRYRSKGQQVVRVERVTVEGGGQAIVGAVETGGRGTDGK